MGNNDTSPNTSFSPYFSEDESDARSEPRGRVLHIWRTCAAGRMGNMLIQGAESLEFSSPAG